MINRYVIMLSGAVLVCGAAYYTGVRHERNAAEARMLSAMETMVARSNELAVDDAAHAAVFAASREKTRVIFRGLEKEVIKYVEVLDSNCGLDADGLRIWNAANLGAAANAAGASDGPVSAVTVGADGPARGPPD